MKTAGILVLALTIALAESQKCGYTKWGKDVAAVEAKFKDCEAKKTGEEFTACMNADEGTFNNCSAEEGSVDKANYEKIRNCLEVVKASCRKESRTVNGAKVWEGKIYISKGEGNRNWMGKEDY